MPSPGGVAIVMSTVASDRTITSANRWLLMSSRVFIVGGPAHRPVGRPYSARRRGRSATSGARSVLRTREREVLRVDGAEDPAGREVHPQRHAGGGAHVGQCAGLGLGLGHGGHQGSPGQSGGGRV